MTYNIFFKKSIAKKFFLKKIVHIFAIPKNKKRTPILFCKITYTKQKNNY